jgi:hypothetical protein
MRFNVETAQGHQRRGQLLYCVFSAHWIGPPTGWRPENIGRGGGIRTHGLFVPKHNGPSVSWARGQRFTGLGGPDRPCRFGKVRGRCHSLRRSVPRNGTDLNRGRVGVSLSLGPNSGSGRRSGRVLGRAVGSAAVTTGRSARIRGGPYVHSDVSVSADPHALDSAACRHRRNVFNEADGHEVRREHAGPVPLLGEPWSGKVVRGRFARRRGSRRHRSEPYRDRTG